LELVILLVCREGLSNGLSTTEEEKWNCPYPEEWILQGTKKQPVGEFISEERQSS